MIRVLIFMLFCCAPALAADDEAKAEYVRLAQEMEALSSRNAWAGVERLYSEIEDLDVESDHQVHVAGAHAARAMGNVTAARTRLSKANDLVEDKEIIDWLWEIDQQYGRVFIAADNGKRVKLQIEQMPFNPDQRKAVEYAQERVKETGMFDGLLPAGDYTFGPYSLEVVPRVQSVRIDMRTQFHKEDKDKKKKKKKGKGKKGRKR